MLKTAVAPSTPVQPRSSLDTWLDLERTASVHMTSEDPNHPFDNALRGCETEGWRASEPGPHTIRVKFDKPTSIRRIHLEFREPHVERSQEFTLYAIVGGRRRHIVRQQWTFSPDGSTREVEDYTVNLPAVSALEVRINPDRHNHRAFASLQSLAIA
jgi:F5/8 type C domain